MRVLTPRGWTIPLALKLLNLAKILDLKTDFDITTTATTTMMS